MPRPAHRSVPSDEGCPRHRFDVTMRRSGPHLVISGELDLATAPRLTALLDILLRYPAPVAVDASRVTFADCAGIRPLLEVSRRDPTAPRVHVVETSAAFRRPFAVLGVRCQPCIDTAAWDTVDADRTVALRTHERRDA